MVDKTVALELRAQGLTYKQIAAQLGCSETWCRHNLRGGLKGEVKPTDGLSVKLSAIAILEEALMKIREL